MYLFLFLNNFFSLILQRCKDTLRGGRKGGEEKEREGEEKEREGGEKGRRGEREGEKKRGMERRKRGRERQKGGRRTRFQTIMVVKNECLLHTHTQTDRQCGAEKCCNASYKIPSLFVERSVTSMTSTHLEFPNLSLCIL